MGKPCDPAKERYWRKVLQRQAASGLGIGRFCERKRIPTHQFYWWRRNLSARDRRPPLPGDYTETRRPVRRRRRRGAESPFLPLPLSVSVAVPIEIVHPRGHVLRIPPLFDAGVLGRILTTLDAVTGSAEEE